MELQFVQNLQKKKAFRAEGAAVSQRRCLLRPGSRTPIDSKIRESRRLPRPRGSPPATGRHPSELDSCRRQWRRAS